LALRRTIDMALKGDDALLPPHVAQKIKERVDGATRRNAALDLDYYQTLAGKLEFSDFRELQDIIVSKNLWPLFEPRFASKTTLSTKFDQLANLRNSIRHSRTVDPVVRKEGEAAILWFNQILAK
jgi:hypothetical protein